jgi:basic membrane protein A and related proteins
MYKNLAATLVAACFFSSVFSQNAPAPQRAPEGAPTKSQEPLKAAWVYVAPLTDAGWVRQHDEGRKAVQAALGDRVKTSYVENVPEGADAERVIRDLAAQGNKIIFTPSFGYMEATMRVASEFPDVKFESITGYKTAVNVSTANARYYEGRYLAGIAAGRMTKTSIAGYVAGFPIPEVLQGINAFTLGMRSVNPKAQVKILWLNAWFDPPKERDAAMTLMNQEADVLAFHTGSNAVMIAAQERGKMAVAYHSDMRKVAPDAQILAVTHQWGSYYTQRTKAALDGTWKRATLWGGIQEGMIRVDSFGPRVPAAVVNEVNAAQKAIGAGKLKPFAALTQDVLDNEGKPFIARGSMLTDAQILSMNQLVAGVVGKTAK